MRYKVVARVFWWKGRLLDHGYIFDDDEDDALRRCVKAGLIERVDTEFNTQEESTVQEPVKTVRRSSTSNVQRTGSRRRSRRSTRKKT